MSRPPIDAQQVQQALEDFLDPETGRSVVTMGQLRDIAVDGDQITVTLALTTFCAPLWTDTQQAAVDQLKARLPHAASVRVQLVEHQRPPEKLGQIGITAKSVIAVGSGKGGVGKSTIATALACALQRSGCAVGLMDADVYGPSIPHLLGLSGRPEVADGRIEPARKNGMCVMSMGFLVPPGEAVVWRGPMLHGAITQFLRDTNWGLLDYLIIDMPPGTGDIALTLSQLLPLSGAVVVCTPQEVALLDAVKAIAMFRKVEIPLLGMVENMSGFVAPDSQTRYDIFGSGGAKTRAAELNVPFLGDVPILLPIREQGDKGQMDQLLDDPQAGPCLQQLSYRLVQNLVVSRAERPPLPTLSVL